jgi:hypothetical protein
VTLAERAIAHALELLAEMPKDARLTLAKGALFHAADLIGDYAKEQRRGRREVDTEPAPPPSFREPVATLPEGAE